jgi:hypothetical protein
MILLPVSCLKHSGMLHVPPTRTLKSVFVTQCIDVFGVLFALTAMSSNIRWLVFVMQMLCLL